MFQPQMYTIAFRWWLQRFFSYSLGLAQSRPWEPAHTEEQATHPIELEAFEHFVHTYERRIVNYLWRMVNDQEAAMDLSQEVFVRAWQHFSLLRTYEQPHSWLFRVATNLALSYRQRRRSPIGSALNLYEMTDPGRSDPALHIAERDLVHRLLAQLSPKRRAVLILREVYGMPATEIAPILNMSPEAVRLALFRAREQFRKLYQREEQ